ncbi:aldose epimerase family protein [Bacillus sp. OAE603]|uniref:aldose epimerase family protein n=1 Tax=Gottfriedia sp. OAE603 TaxID=2663872 RepID=UPI00178BD599
MLVSHKQFGMIDGKIVTAFTITNDQGMEVTTLDYGCIITKILAPDKKGNIENIVLGFDSIEEYTDYSPYFGAVIGRFAGRIKNGEFELNDQVYHIAQNNLNNHLHGGVRGFDKVNWATEIKEGKDSISLQFTYLSPDGEEGFPGNVNMSVIYTLNNKNELILSYEGHSDQKTLLNITNHTYFNLSGNLKTDILDHSLKIKSTRFLELNHELIPTGETLSVENTPFDFRSGRKIKDGVSSTHPQNILAGNGYDHPFILDKSEKNQVILCDASSGRKLMIETDQPAVVLYTGTQLSEDYSIRGVKSRKYIGLCLETQGFPDSIHHSNFPSNIIEKDEIYRATTKLSFSVI